MTNGFGPQDGSHGVHKSQTLGKSVISRVADMETTVDVAGALSVTPLPPQESAVLRALIACSGRVVCRRELSRLAGIADLNERRCDSLLVSIRKALGPESIRTVRGRGWMINHAAIDQATSLLAA
jgi:DNA-binding response OmpR family regulator